MSADPVDDFACPSCGAMDLVRKVSAIYAGETATGRYQGSSTGIGALFGSSGGPILMSTGTTLRGSSQTILSQQLAPPLMPRARSVWGTGSMVIVTLLIALFVVFGLDALYGDQDDNSRVWFLTLGAGTALVVIFAGKYMIKRSRANAAQAALPAWEQEMDQWDRQFYCGRCDLVFVPNGN